MCGGAGAPSKPTEEELEILTPVIEAYLIEQCGKKPSDIKITEVSRQLVAGVNYFTKVCSIIH